MTPEQQQGFIETVKQSGVATSLGRRALGTAKTLAAKPARAAKGTAATMAGKPVGRGARAAQAAAKAPTVSEKAVEPGLLGAVGSAAARGLDRLGGRGTGLVNRLGARNLSAGHGSSSGVRALRQLGGGALAAGGAGAAGLGGAALASRRDRG